jgi:hypothetical protein
MRGGEYKRGGDRGRALSVSRRWEEPVTDAGLVEPARPALRATAKLRYDKVRQRFILLLAEKAVLLNESGAEWSSSCAAAVEQPPGDNYE